jgi:Zn-finger protein
MMNEDTKKKLLAMGAVNTLKKSKKFQEFEIVDTVRDCKCIVRGGIINDHILFKIKADNELLEVKGDRFYMVEDRETKLAFSAEIAKAFPGVLAKSVATEKRKEPGVKEPKKKAVITEAGTHTHKNYDGTNEEVPANLYCNKITCKCGNVRWVKNADMFQVKMCKPCVWEHRKSGASKRIAEMKKKKEAEKKGAAKKGKK